MSLRYLMRTVISRKGLVRNPTSFIRGHLMHTDTMAGDTILSSRRNFLGLWIGTNKVGVSHFDYASREVKVLWPTLNRKDEDIFTIANELKKIIENYEILGLVVGRPWITEEEQVEPDHIEKVAKKRMQEHGMAGLVMSKDEEKAKNHSNDEAVKVESFIQDLTNTGILKGVDYMYYHTKVFVNPLNVKRRIQQLKLERHPTYLFEDVTDLEEDFHIGYAAQFILMHYVTKEVIPILTDCTVKQRDVSVVEEIEFAPNKQVFVIAPED
ncbi:hypothetical protein EZV62_018710 [Acer yangbiense]|uniref:Uncharacterized protein n=1 Tax=Acer yangbiense TaxID=1000413 RepID=A0A5C7HK52_9ROSI|nr:hypothetical protein EZV62_018710 [Acer yangbiense]